jgi:hypothetical protein
MRKGFPDPTRSFEMYFGSDDVQSISFSACGRAVLTTYAAPPTGPNVISTWMVGTNGVYRTPPTEQETC